MASPDDALLADIRVLDISATVSGAYCGRLLAGFGADVVRIEAPDASDAVRSEGPFPHDKRDPELSTGHLHFNAGKRSVALDWRSMDGRARLIGLLGSFDVLLDSLTEAEASSLGLSLSVLREANPAIHVVSATPWGRYGPRAGTPGNELAVEALSGFAHMHGDPPREPFKLPGWQFECFAGTYAAFATLAALLDPTGAPHLIDVATIDAAVNAVETRYTAWEYTGNAPKRGIASFDRFYPLNIWPCKDGYLALTYYHPRDFEGLALILGDDELINSERFSRNYPRVKNREALNAKLGPLLKKRTKHEVFDAALDLRSATGMVLDAADLVTDPHLRERRAIVTVDHPVAGRYMMPGAPFRTSEGVWCAKRAPLCGEHTADELERPRQHSALSRTDDPTDFRPLDGIRVLDLTTAWAGPSATRALGALGADVIKIESCNRWDGWRGPAAPPPSGAGIYADNDPGERPYERTPLFGAANRNKRGISLDIATPDGNALFMRLLERSDVVVCNFSSRVLPNLGMDFERLSSVKPDVILVSMPAYGASGPYANGVGYGNTIEAMSGLSARFGYRDGAPNITHDLTFGDPVAGAHAAFGVLLALCHRKRTGRGLYIDLSQQETLLGQLGEGLAKYSLDRQAIGREEAKSCAYAPHGYYPAEGDDEWIAIAAPGENEWSALRSYFDNAAWMKGSRFAMNADRLANQSDLDTLLASETAGRNKFELSEGLAAVGVIAAPVLNFTELRADEHLRARQVFEKVVHPEVGLREFSRLPIVVDAAPILTIRPTPLFAQHNAEVYRDLLALARTEEDRLTAAGVIGEVPLSPADSPGAATQNVSQSDTTEKPVD